MLGTYASLALSFGASALVGQAILVACGRHGRAWLAPAVGLAALAALAWWTVRLPGEGVAAAIAVGIAAGASALYLRGRLSLRGEGPALGAAVALAAAVAASLPFIAEGRFGILGTGLNPDMSQHLFAADRLADGGAERLIDGGYPLGPHSLVVALGELGIGPVQAFDGLMLAIAVAACLAPLALLGRFGRARALAGALCVGFAYLVAANLVQGAFKETMQALFVLAFVIGLTEIAEGDRSGERPGPSTAIPLAVLAVGSVYVYSFPGLLWLAGAAGAWAIAELVLRRADAVALARGAVGTVAVALGVLVVAVAPELGRIADFASFETFDPDGAGLGNLFNRLSPLEALGIWPTGDFRVEPGDGAVPALAFYLGGAVGLAALGFGLAWSWRRRSPALPAALAAATALWLYSLIAGTPYQEAKALVLAAPLVALVSIRALASVPGPALAAFCVLAGGSSLLVLANGQVGPSGYSPALAELRPQLGDGSTVVEAPAELLADQHGRDYLVWELRGNRICVHELGAGGEGPEGARTVVVELDEDGAVVPLGVGNDAAPERGEPCPFIPDGARADPAGDG